MYRLSFGGDWIHYLCYLLSLFSSNKQGLFLLLNKLMCNTIHRVYKLSVSFSVI